VGVLRLETFGELDMSEKETRARLVFRKTLNDMDGASALDR